MFLQCFALCIWNDCWFYGIGDSRVKIFLKVEHEVRRDDEAACKVAEEANQDLLEWFLNHVK